MQLRMLGLQACQQGGDREQDPPGHPGQRKAERGVIFSECGRENDWQVLSLRQGKPVHTCLSVPTVRPLNMPKTDPLWVAVLWTRVRPGAPV